MIENKNNSPELQVHHIEQLVEQTPEIAGLQAYEYLRSNVASQKAAFVSRKIDQLDLEYADLTRSALDRIETPIKGALESLMPGETSPKKVGVFESIAYRYGELSMLSAAMRMNDVSLSAAEREEAKDWFVLTNEALYDKPEKRVFSALATRHLLPQLAKDVSGLQIASGIQQDLAGLVGEISETDYEQFVPSQAIIDVVHGLVVDRFEPVYSHIATDKLYTAQEMVPAIDEALRKMGGTDKGWKAVLIADSTALAVSAHQKIVEVGENRTDLEGNDLRGKVLHEVGVHAGRSINAESAGWLSAQYGQDGYLDFEEAFATALEDAYKGIFADHGVNHYLIAGLAYGRDNHEPRDFAQTYEVMWRSNALKAQESDIDITSDQINKAKNSAFTACMRLFRGTTTHDKGVVYLKDLAYFKGQELAWSVLAHTKTQADFDLLLAGKLDLTREDHYAIAEDIVNTNNAQ